MSLFLVVSLLVSLFLFSPCCGVVLLLCLSVSIHQILFCLHRISICLALHNVSAYLSVIVSLFYLTLLWAHTYTQTNAPPLALPLPVHSSDSYSLSLFIYLSV